jgi:endonuclease/exonuclease/phosphatase family metal-dependent hydrolase
VRDNATPYVKGETFETVIDGFLISPNLEIINTKTHDLGFKNSDHNPVTVTLKFVTNK